MNNIIGIVAEKLGHSLSPYIHNYWSKKYKQKLQYQKFEVSEKHLDKFFQSFKKNKKIPARRVGDCAKLCQDPWHTIIRLYQHL